MNRTAVSPMSPLGPRLWSSVLFTLCLLASEASANHLHYIPLENDPIYAPRIIDVTGSEDSLHEWIIESGENDPQFFSRNATEVQFTRPPNAPISDTNAVFDVPFFEDVTNTSATAFVEIEVSGLAATDDESLEIGLTDLVSSITWNEAQQTIRADADTHVATNTPRWSDLASIPYRVHFYYRFADFVFTVVFVDDVGTASAPISWKAAAANPFQNFFGAIGGLDPDNLDIYPFVSCQVDCTITVLDTDIVNCDTDGADVDIDSCRPLAGVGNGIVDPGETCDDGNTVSGDGCDENGQLEKSGWKCQQAIGKAGKKYAQLRLDSLQKCRNLINKGATLFRDEAKTDALAGSAECPGELKTARKLAKAGEKARKLVSAKCTDPLVAALASCGDTIDQVVSDDGTSGCLVDTHDAAVAAMLLAEYGN